MNFKKYISYPRFILCRILWSNAKLLKNDKHYLSLCFWCYMGYKMNWNHPVTFCEKMQWLKLYNKNPLYSELVDKIKVKKYVAGIIGEKYIIPTLAVWERAEDINFSILPNKFVLKTTHGGGNNGVVICKNKSTLDKIATIHTFKNMLKKDIYYSLREWPYKNVSKRVIAEKFIESDNIDSTFLTDYKFYCFNGHAKYCQLIANRSTDETIDFYDREWNHQEFIGLLPTAHHAQTSHSTPINYKEMFAIADKLSASIGAPFVRIDLYNVNGTIYFGEVTFYPASGLGKFNPSGWDKRLGEMINLEGISFHTP